MATITVNTLRNITGTDNTAVPISGDFVSVARNFNNAKVPATELRDAIEAFVLAKLNERQSVIDAAQAQLITKQALIDAMGGTVEGLRLAKLARRQAAVDARAAAEALAASKAAEIVAIDAEA